MQRIGNAVEPSFVDPAIVTSIEQCRWCTNEGVLLFLSQTSWFRRLSSRVVIFSLRGLRHAHVFAFIFGMFIYILRSMHVWVFVCVYVMYVRIHVYLCVWYVCMYVQSMYVCLSIYMYVFMYMCMSICTCMYLCIYLRTVCINVTISTATIERELALSVEKPLQYSRIILLRSIRIELSRHIAPPHPLLYS